MTVADIEEKLKDRRLFEKSLVFSTNSDVFSSLFRFLGITVLIIFSIADIVGVIRDGYPFFDFNMRMAIGLGVFLLLLGLMCKFLSKRINYKTYDPLYQYYMQNMQVREVQPLFYDKNRDGLGIWIIALRKDEQTSLESILNSMYNTDSRMQRIIESALKSSMKKRGQKDRVLKEKIISFNPVLAQFDLRLYGHYYRPNAVPKYFIYLKTSIPGKNYRPFVDDFFEVDISKLVI